MSANTNTPREPDIEEDDAPTPPVFQEALTEFRQMLAGRGMAGVAIVARPEQGASGIYMAADWTAWKFDDRDEGRDGESMKMDATPEQIRITLHVLNGLIEGLDQLKMELVPRVTGLSLLAMRKMRAAESVVP